MSDAKVTSKGQITVPKIVRERLNVGPGDYLVFREEANGTIVVEAATTDLMALAGSVPSKVHGVTIEAMYDAVRLGAAARVRRASGGPAKRK
ncbi:MAG: AbrB/MazE/SpoVT family DNA-binding domain-containing protein [Gemmatimonadales bacterium]|jgi:AbrB family looped-hinge helix DNA binding protein